MKTALIGYTGFVGSNIANQTPFFDYYNSKNINEIKNKSYNLIVSAGNSSLMWKANLEPQADWINIKRFMNSIEVVKTRYFVLISTIEVYDRAYNVDEDFRIDSSKLKPYGKHRYMLEQFIKERFNKSTIIRLPLVFGKNLKKNFVYDLIYNNRLDLTHKDSLLQLYDLEYIWKDINIAINNVLPIINFSTEPIFAKELAKYTLGMDFRTITHAPPRRYDMITKYASLYGSKTSYLYQKEKMLSLLKKFIIKEKSLL